MIPTEDYWPEAVHPTETQWLDWLLANDREDQLLIAQRVLDCDAMAARCFIQNHEGAMQEVQYLRSQVMRYRLAWRHARIRAWALQRALS